MLDAIFQRAHLRTATWTNLGVEIRGRRQRGELGGWSVALSRLAESTIDVAIQELHWSTVNAVGLPRESYPVVALTNLLGSLEAPHKSDHSLAAFRAAQRMSNAVHQDGLLVICGDDPILVDATAVGNAAVAITSLSFDSPILQDHLQDGGSGAWQGDSTIRIGDERESHELCQISSLSVCLDGDAPFELANAMTAASIAFAIGVDVPTIISALSDFRIAPNILPGSFNVFGEGLFRTVIDSASPSWFLRPLLRAVNPLNSRRLITVIGELQHLPADDVQEVGRLLGRAHGAIVIHSNPESRELTLFRKGISANQYPPLIIHLPTERRALNRALKTARPNDELLILTHGDPGPSIRAVGRYLSMIA
jgi:cyanophycin synthetase